MAETKKYLDYEGLKIYDTKIKALIESGDYTEEELIALIDKELAAQLIPEDAQESLDTLVEIADWIQKHPEDAAAMNTDISALRDEVGKASVAATDTTEAVVATGLHKDVEDLDARLDTLETSTYIAITEDEINDLFPST